MGEHSLLRSPGLENRETWGTLVWEWSERQVRSDPRRTPCQSS
jgi:hypothetical protein